MRSSGKYGISPSAATAALFLCAPVGGQELPRPIQEYFGDFSGCALIQSRDRHEGVNIEFNPRQCHLPQSPCSTFKIPNALIGLQTGVVSGAGDVKEWDGTVHQYESRNRDHDLASAIRFSVVWYFQALASDVGEERMAQWLQELEYGNQDISAGIDRFWLSSSMKIDAYQQMDLLKALTHGALPFKPEYQQVVRDMLAYESDLPGSLHGKTGSCLGFPDGEPDHGWFVGWLEAGTEKNPSTTWFVINIRGEGAWGPDAREIALQLLTDLRN